MTARKMDATARDEVPAFLRGVSGDIFALATLPTTAPNGFGILLLQGGRGMPSFGRNRLWVEIAREFAGVGFHVGRFDYRGVGDSTGSPETVRLDAPYTEDALTVIEWMSKEWKIKAWILMGSCFGARTALAAGSRLQNTAGLAFFPIPVRDFRMGEQFVSYPLSWYLARATRPSAWIGLFDRARRGNYQRAIRAKVRHSLSQRSQARTLDTGKGQPGRGFYHEVSEVVNRGVPLLFIYGERDLFYEDFRKARSGRLGPLIDEADSRVTVHVIEGKVHGLTSIEVQRQVRTLLDGWLAKWFTGTDEVAESG